MTGECVEQRNGGYYVAGTRISLDSVVYSFQRGNSPEGIQSEYPLLKTSQINDALAFYAAHQETIDRYLENKRREFEASGIPLSQANPELWARLERARRTWTSDVFDIGEPRKAREVSRQLTAV
ncbi:MAG: DUF433 domain-containing protein [Bryobacteraceae bacterium]